MDNPFRKKRKTGSIEETIKKLAAGQVTLEELLNPDPLYIVFARDGKYEIGMGKNKVVYNSREELEAWADKQPKDAKLIWVTPAPGCEPLPDPKTYQSEHDSRRLATPTIEPVEANEVFTDDQKKARWWAMFGNKSGNEDKKKKKIKTSHIPVIIPDEVSTYCHDYAIAGYLDKMKAIDRNAYWELEDQKQLVKELNYPISFNTDTYGI